jgi:Luciferase-like monooxygenase/von Willebrand factor type A domain
LKIKVGFGLGTSVGSALEPTNFWSIIDTLESDRWDSIWLSERVSGGAFGPIAAIAAVAGRTRRLKFGFSVLVLPGRNPVLLAKELATIDALSNGRLIAAFGLGVEDPKEQAVFGVVDRKEAAARSEEAVRLIQRLWTETGVPTKGTISTSGTSRCCRAPHRRLAPTSGSAATHARRFAGPRSSARAGCRRFSLDDAIPCPLRNGNMSAVWTRATNVEAFGRSTSSHCAPTVSSYRCSSRAARRRARGRSAGEVAPRWIRTLEAPTSRPLARERSRSRAHRTMRLAWSHSLENSRVLFRAVDRDPTRVWMLRRMLVVLFVLLLGCSAPAVAEEAKPAGHPSAALFVFDASGSILRNVEGKSKDEIARSVTTGVLTSLDSDVRVGLVTFGHRRKGDCTDLEVLAPVGTDRAAISKTVGAIKPKGERPLAEAVKLAVARRQHSRDRWQRDDRSGPRTRIVQGQRAERHQVERVRQVRSRLQVQGMTLEMGTRVC